jgi:hypothetical protein
MGRAAQTSPARRSAAQWSGRVLSPHGDAAGDAGPGAGAVSLGALAFGAATGDPGSLLAPAPGTP